MSKFDAIKAILKKDPVGMTAAGASVGGAGVALGDNLRSYLQDEGGGGDPLTQAISGSVVGGALGPTFGAALGKSPKKQALISLLGALGLGGMGYASSTYSRNKWDEKQGN